LLVVGLAVLVVVLWEGSSEQGAPHTVKASAERASGGALPEDLPRPVAGEATDVLVAPSNFSADGEPDTSLEEEYALIVARLQSMSDADLEKIVDGDMSWEQWKASWLGQRFSDLWNRSYEMKKIRYQESIDSDLLERQRASVKANGRSLPEFVVAQEQLYAEMAESGNDLSGAECRALESEQRERVLAVLLAKSYGSTRRHLTVYMQLLRRVAATHNEVLAEHFPIAPLMLSGVRHSQNLHEIWQIAMDSNMESLIGDVYYEMRRYPVEEVEPLLALGLRDPRWPVQFGASLCTRWYGSEGKLSNPAAIARELVAAARARARAEQTWPCVLLLETVAAIGQADPALLELVVPSTEAALRNLAATTFVRGVDESIALHWIETWLADDVLFEAGIYALGVLPGDPADDLLRTMAGRVTNPGLKVALLSAMAGRGPQFIAEFVKAREAEDADVRRAALSGLMALVGDARMDGATEILLTEGLLATTAEDPDPASRQQAAVGLALHGSETAFSGLRERFLAENDSEVRGFTGGLLLLASGADAERRDWVERRIGEESLAVRSVLEDFHDSLRDPARRGVLMDELAEQSNVVLKADNMGVSEGRAKDPIGQMANMARAMQTALGAWAALDEPLPAVQADSP
jgi:hypothetical protein